MAPRILSDLGGTLLSYLRIGTARIKNDSNIIIARNSGDTANLPIGGKSLQALADDGKKVIFAPQEGMSANLNLSLPTADGSTGQALVTNGSGTLSFATIATASNVVKEYEEVIAYDSSSPVAVFTPPASARISKIKVEVETAFNGTAPTLSVGVSGGTARYMGTTDNDLKTTGIYEVDAAYEEDASPEEIIITFNTDSSTEGSARVSITYANPS